MPVRLNGSTSGYTELSAPAVAGNNSIALPTGNGSAYQILRNGATAGSLEYTDKLVSGTAVASTSGTSIDFTGIPSWAKRVTVMFDGVSLSGTSNFLFQIGAGSMQSTGYNGSGASVSNTAGNNCAGAISTAGFICPTGIAAGLWSGSCVLSLLGSNKWAAQGIIGTSVATAGTNYTAGSVTLSGTLDRVRITTVNGTDTFDAGSINLLWE
jgi:hypothetical protein